MTVTLWPFLRKPRVSSVTHRSAPPQAKEGDTKVILKVLSSTDFSLCIGRHYRLAACGTSRRQTEVCRTLVGFARGKVNILIGAVHACKEQQLFCHRYNLALPIERGPVAEIGGLHRFQFQRARKNRRNGRSIKRLLMPDAMKDAAAIGANNPAFKKIFIERHGAK